MHKTSTWRPLWRPPYEQDGVQHSVMGTSLPGPSGVSWATAAASDSTASWALVLLCCSLVLSYSGEFVSLHVVQSILSPWRRLTSFWVNLQFTQVFSGMLTLGIGVTSVQRVNQSLPVSMSGMGQACMLIHPHSGAPEAEFSHVTHSCPMCRWKILKSFRTCFCSKIQLKHKSYIVFIYS